MHGIDVIMFGVAGHRSVVVAVLVPGLRCLCNIAPSKYRRSSDSNARHFNIPCNHYRISVPSRRGAEEGSG